MSVSGVVVQVQVYDHFVAREVLLLVQKIRIAVPWMPKRLSGSVVWWWSYNVHMLCTCGCSLSV